MWRQIAGFRLTVAAATAAGLIACGGPSKTVEPTASSTSTLGPVTTFGGIVGKASKDACLLDVRTVQQASDLYAAREGMAAPSIDALVTAGLLQTPPSTSHGYVIRYDATTGKVTASGAC